MEYSEPELILPALQILRDYYPDGLSTHDLMGELRSRLKPTGRDLVPLAGLQEPKLRICLMDGRFRR